MPRISRHSSPVPEVQLQPQLQPAARSSINLRLLFPALSRGSTNAGSGLSVRVKLRDSPLAWAPNVPVRRERSSYLCGLPFPEVHGFPILKSLCSDAQA
jgi:hypothetical protein